MRKPSATTTAKHTVQFAFQQGKGFKALPLLSHKLIITSFIFKQTEDRPEEKDRNIVLQRQY